MSPRQHCRGLVTFRRTTCRAISRFQAAGPGFAHLPPERGFFYLRFAGDLVSLAASN